MRLGQQLSGRKRDARQKTSLVSHSYLDHFNTSSLIFIILMVGHIKCMRAVDHIWSDQQLRCYRYWQSGAVRLCRSKGYLKMPFPKSGLSVFIGRFEWLARVDPELLPLRWPGSTMLGETVRIGGII